MHPLTPTSSQEAKGTAVKHIQSSGQQQQIELRTVYIHEYTVSFPRPSSSVCIRLTVRELGVAELQVLAGPGRVVLGAHGVLHALDILFEVVEGAEDVLHALAIVHHGARCVGLHVAGAPRLLGGQDGQRLDHLTGGALWGKGAHERDQEGCRLSLDVF